MLKAPFPFNALANRLKNVRVLCGDWLRVFNPSILNEDPPVGIFLDPPYSIELYCDGCYAIDSIGLSAAVEKWAIENGNNPKLRIALCGLDEEYIMPETWDCIHWKAQGGYANQGDTGNENRNKERIWFSPACLSPGLF